MFIRRAFGEFVSIHMVHLFTCRKLALPFSKRYEQQQKTFYSKKNESHENRTGTPWICIYVLSPHTHTLLFGDWFQNVLEEFERRRMSSTQWICNDRIFFNLAIFRIYFSNSLLLLLWFVLSAIDMVVIQLRFSPPLSFSLSTGNGFSMNASDNRQDWDEIRAHIETVKSFHSSSVLTKSKEIIQFLSNRFSSSDGGMNTVRARWISESSNRLTSERVHTVEKWWTQWGKQECWVPRNSS